MKPTRTLLPLILLLALLVPGCGGGGGGGVAGLGGNGGIGGTGISSTGTIDGFGSIFVNGVEYETGNSEVSLNGASSSADNLRLGMVVTVRGTVNEDRKTGTASQVIFDSEVTGPVASIEIGLDNTSMRITVLGVTVIAERTATVFDGVTFDSLALDDLVEVSGFVENGTQLRATRIEKKSVFVPDDSEIELKGFVAGLTATQFSLGEYVVDYSSADLSDIPGGSVTEGLHVEVKGTLNGTVVRATRIEQEDDLRSGFDDQDEISIQGAISQFIDNSNFVVDGVTVDASSATLQPVDLVLADGVIVEVEGTWNGTLLVAKEVHSRRGRVKLEARVASVNTAEATLTLQYPTGTITVAVASTTLMKDDTGQANPLRLADIASGNFLEIEAIQVGDALVASRIRRDQPDDSILQGPVDSFNAGIDITVLGITFSTAGAKFEGEDDGEIGSDAFFTQLQPGDLVKIKDEDPADGVADEIEFERGDALDGSEFDDDSDHECAGDQAAANDDCDSEDDHSDDGGSNSGSSDDNSGDDNPDDGGTDDGGTDDGGTDDGGSSDDSPDDGSPDDA